MLNLTNGQITRQQYLDWSQQMRARWQNGGGWRGGQPGRGAPDGTPQRQGPQDQGQGGGINVDAWAEVQFRRLDRNGDGLLNWDEMPEDLRAQRDTFDKNKDGSIDLAEFKEYMKSRATQWRAENGGGNRGGAAPTGTQPIIITEPPPTAEEEETKPVVYRTGKLPKEAESFFRQYDKDGDGQIGLYEWKNSGQPLEIFFAMDRNGDGFVTVEEYLRYLADQNKKTGPRPGTASPGAGGPPAFGGPGAPNFTDGERRGGNGRGGNGPPGPPGGRRQGRGGGGGGPRQRPPRDGSGG
jgi:Ca2+-binding EF-hand superfamily protein